MALHRLQSLTVGVPDVAGTAGYYADFGLRQVAPGRFATVHGGEQFFLAHSPVRRLLAMSVAADDPDDLARIAARLTRLGLPSQLAGTTLRTREPVADILVEVVVAERLVIEPHPPTPYNGPGRIERPGTRAPVLSRTGPVRPLALGHVVIGSVEQESTQRFFTEGIGFRVSDVVPGTAAFLRCSTDHHNVLVQQAPLNFLHHTSWQVADVDEVGRGATGMLAEHPERHVWGLGRHHIGSNFFWYLKDPAGNFSEYYADMDCIVDDQLWTPRSFEGVDSLYSWGPPPPPSFIHPEDLASLMTGAHTEKG
ncbi:VOC family protein [Streptomyces sp. SID8352]|uniref:VOC family protein n=1 Tax=Streptomyces sp. SID8352 TaxID=2690338 RepID=UPI00136EC261|nr:VOC family protein [Streptomyces sp. SID8352]MYU26069.1 dioxygenase [Streptomyces sp. SID8352]